MHETIPQFSLSGFVKSLKTLNINKQDVAILSVDNTVTQSVLINKQTWYQQVLSQVQIAPVLSHE